MVEKMKLMKRKDDKDGMCGKGENKREGGIGKEGNEEIACVPSRYMLLYAIETWSFIAQLCHVLMKQVFTT